MVPSGQAAAAPAFVRLVAHPLRWLLLDVAPRVLPELDRRLSETTDRVLRERGVEVRMETSVEEATSDGVRLTSGETVPTRTLVWCVGVRPGAVQRRFGMRCASPCAAVLHYASNESYRPP